MAFDPLQINPGDLRHAITITAPDTSSRDAYGQPSATWTTVLATRAKIEDQFSAGYRDTFAQNAMTAQSSKVVTIRWPGSTIEIKPGQRVAYGNDTYEIQAVSNVLERDRVLRLAVLAIEDGSN